MTRMIILNPIIIMEVRTKNKFRPIWIGITTLIYSDLSLWKIMDKNQVGMNPKMDKNQVGMYPKMDITILNINATLLLKRVTVTRRNPYIKHQRSHKKREKDRN